jgi:hypothetical protein
MRRPWVRTVAEKTDLIIGNTRWYLFGSALRDPVQAADVDLLMVCQDHSDAAVKGEMPASLLSASLSILTEDEEAETSFVVNQRCIRVFPVCGRRSFDLLSRALHPQRRLLALNRERPRRRGAASRAGCGPSAKPRGPRPRHRRRRTWRWAPERRCRRTGAWPKALPEQFQALVRLLDQAGAPDRLEGGRQELQGRDARGSRSCCGRWWRRVRRGRRRGSVTAADGTGHRTGLKSAVSAARRSNV